MKDRELAEELTEEMTRVYKANNQFTEYVDAFSISTGRTPDETLRLEITRLVYNHYKVNKIIGDCKND